MRSIILNHTNTPDERVPIISSCVAMLHVFLNEETSKRSLILNHTNTPDERVPIISSCVAMLCSWMKRQACVQ